MKRNSWIATRRKKQLFYRGTRIRITAPFSPEAMQARKKWSKIFKEKQNTNLEFCISRDECSVMSNSLQPLGLLPTRLLSPSSRQKNRSGLPFLLQGIFLTQGSNPSLLYWQVDSLPMRQLGSPHIQRYYPSKVKEKTLPVLYINYAQLSVCQKWKWEHRETFGGDEYVITWLWWRFHSCIHMSKLTILCT